MDTIYIRLIQNIKDNIDKYDFSGDKQELPELEVTINNFSSNVDEILPVACTCGKRLNETRYRELLSEGYEKREIFENMGIRRLCCMSSYGSPMPLEHNITSTYSVNTGRVNEVEINKNKKELANKVSKLLYKKLKSDIIKEVKDREENRLEKYTQQEIDEIFDIAESKIRKEIYNKFYDKFKDEYPEDVYKIMKNKITNPSVSKKLFNMMLEDYSREEYNRISKKYNEDKLRNRIDSESSPLMKEALVKRYFEDKLKTSTFSDLLEKEDNKYFKSILNSINKKTKKVTSGNIRVIELSKI